MTTLLTDQIRSWVGREVTYVAPEELGRAAIRYFARAIGDDNPLYTDEAFACSHGYDGVIAPPTLVCETNQYADLPRNPDGYAGHSWPLPPPGTRLVRGGNQYAFHRPVRPSDVLTVTWRITDVAERATAGGKAMLVISSRADYQDADGQPLATNTETLLCLEA